MTGDTALEQWSAFLAAEPVERSLRDRTAHFTDTEWRMYGDAVRRNQ